MTRSTALGCDIVLPVFNALAYAKECIASVLRETGDVPYRLYVVDDASDRVTAAYLAREAARHPHLVHHRNRDNIGFLRSCNLGISLGSEPYVVLLNSDVIVTPGWLGRLVQCAESDPQIAAVNPFSNNASNIDIPLAPGASFLDMDAVLARRSPRRYPDVVTGVGFCLLLRRSALAQVGVFDEVYGRGYCEDSDLCMRLTAAGFRTVIADDVYVYHKRAASFRDRDRRYAENRRIFDTRWGPEYRRQFAVFRARDPLRAARDLFRLPRRWDPLGHMRRTYYELRRAWRRRDPVGVAREAARGARRLPGAKRPVVTAERVARITRPGRLRITYVLHGITIGGGVLSVAQLVNELTLLGAAARLAALRARPEVSAWKWLVQPMIFGSWPELLANFPQTDVAVATHWTTAEPVARLVVSRRARVAAYFVQDYEPWFFPEHDRRARQRVRRTYELIEHRIVKSDWLRGMLARDGFAATKIRLGMDLGMFYPRDVPRPPRPRVLAMVRPETPRRGFPDVIEALCRIGAEVPEVEIVLFGADVPRSRIPLRCQSLGVISDQDRLAELYSSASVFLDGSVFQGFGRPALEAMACGAACVLTNVGGVREYARDEENCLLVPPGQPEAFAEAVRRILSDPALRLRLADGGLRTVPEYCMKREARETLAYFTALAGESTPTP